MRAFQILVVGPDASLDSALCLFSVPDGYDPRQPWPLLVALHGYGSGATPFHHLWQPVARKAGYDLVAPQGERTAEGIGWGWGPNSEQVVRRSIDVVMGRVHIDRSRIFLTDFSQGGHLTYTLAEKHTHTFSGIAPLGQVATFPIA